MARLPLYSPVIAINLLIIILLHKVTAKEVSVSAKSAERIQLIRDAVEWMTFRRAGNLVPQQELGPLFSDELEKKYKTSNSYRAFVIAFEQGVLPRMTLNESDPCNPEYVTKYKDPFNNSVTWLWQMKFTFLSFDNFGQDWIGQYCDYRQGLICSPQTKKCQCPEGSKLESLEPSSPIRRCLLQKDEVCALIDLDHGDDPKHSTLASHMYHLAFNPEKPPSCTSGTQCRFKLGSRNLPRCYDTGPWEEGSWRLSFSEECAVGLIADSGSCAVKPPGDFGREGYICYNFGPPRSQTTDPFAENRIGFCFWEQAVYGIDSSEYGPPFFRPYFIRYVNPRTVPFRGQELIDYYAKFIGPVKNLFLGVGTEAVEAYNHSDPCNIQKTSEFETLWQYFANLTKDPPPGSDYVATATELEAHLQAVLDLGTDVAKKVCRIYWSVALRGLLHVSLKCVAVNSTDAAGNDGECEGYGNLPYDTISHGTLVRFYDYTGDAEYANENGYPFYRFRSGVEDILDRYPEAPCVPHLGPDPPQQLRSIHVEVLEGGQCPGSSVCYQDFDDAHGHFDDATCELRPEVKQALVCHDVRTKLGKCEKQYLTGKVLQARENVDDYAQLALGEPCYSEFEKAFRTNDTECLAKLNEYQLLNWIERGILCDQKGGNVECTSNNVCECISSEVCGPPGPGPTSKPRNPFERNDTVKSGGSACVKAWFVVALVIFGVGVILGMYMED